MTDEMFLWFAVMLQTVRWVLSPKLKLPHMEERISDRVNSMIVAIPDRLKDLALNPMSVEYDTEHFLKMHHFIFQDLYEWAGEPRIIAIFKEEDVLGGMSVEYSDAFGQ